jgi:hypothetical protein
VMPSGVNSWKERWHFNRHFRHREWPEPRNRGHSLQSTPGESEMSSRVATV